MNQKQSHSQPSAPKVYLVISIKSKPTFSLCLQLFTTFNLTEPNTPLASVGTAPQVHKAFVKGGAKLLGILSSLAADTIPTIAKSGWRLLFLA